MGLPLQIFGKVWLNSQSKLRSVAVLILNQGSMFGPYTPLQQLDLLADYGTKSYVVGSTNSLLLQQRDRYSDILINVGFLSWLYLFNCHWLTLSMKARWRNYKYHISLSSQCIGSHTRRSPMDWFFNANHQRHVGRCTAWTTEDTRIHGIRRVHSLTVRRVSPCIAILCELPRAQSRREWASISWTAIVSTRRWRGPSSWVQLGLPGTLAVNFQLRPF